MKVATKYRSATKTNGWWQLIGKEELHSPKVTRSPMRKNVCQFVLGSERPNYLISLISEDCAVIRPETYCLSVRHLLIAACKIN